MFLMLFPLCWCWLFPTVCIALLLARTFAHYVLVGRTFAHYVLVGRQKLATPGAGAVAAGALVEIRRWKRRSWCSAGVHRSTACTVVLLFSFVYCYCYCLHCLHCAALLVRLRRRSQRFPRLPPRSLLSCSVFALFRGAMQHKSGRGRWTMAGWHPPLPPPYSIRCIELYIGKSVCLLLYLTAFTTYFVGRHALDSTRIGDLIIVVRSSHFALPKGDSEDRRKLILLYWLQMVTSNQTVS